MGKNTTWHHYATVIRVYLHKVQYGFGLVTCHHLLGLYNTYNTKREKYIEIPV